MPVKFRCYRCNQLLGVSRSKIGAVISCPKCGSALVVPDSEEETVPIAQSVKPALGAVFGPAEPRDSESLLDLRPEDIRVEPGIELLPSAPAALPESADEAKPEEPTAAPALADEAPPPEPAFDLGEIPGEPAAEEVAVPASPPQLLVETHGSARSGDGYGRIRARDVVLPRSVVLAWSLLVLMAVASAFCAGLLAGHFIWRVHEPVNRLTAAPPAR